MPRLQICHSNMQPFIALSTASSPLLTYIILYNLSHIHYYLFLLYAATILN